MSDTLAPAPAGTRTVGTTQISLLLAGSCMSVPGSVLIAPMLPHVGGAGRSVAEQVGGRAGGWPSRWVRSQPVHSTLTAGPNSLVG